MRTSTKRCLTSHNYPCNYPDAYFHPTSLFLYSIKETNVREEHMLFLINEIIFLGWKSYCVHCVIVFPSPFHKPHSEFYLPISSPSTDVSFHPSQVKEQTEDILDGVVISKASTSRLNKVFILSSLIVNKSSVLKFVSPA